MSFTSNNPTKSFNYLHHNGWLIKFQQEQKKKQSIALLKKDKERA
jgi:hypothetical protein